MQEQLVDKAKNGKFDRLCPQISCGIIYVGRGRGGGGGGGHLKSYRLHGINKT